jgi:hypothetical protein
MGTMTVAIMHDRIRAQCRSRRSYGRVCWIVVVVDEDETGGGIGAGMLVVCSVVVVLETVGGGLLQPATNREPADSATIVKARRPGILLVMALLQCLSRIGRVSIV